jgi:spore coat polysaccharide biosynthesis protein SpsF (cytidylyltransferase family)
MISRQDDRVGIVIQARMGSNRFPGKVMAPIGSVPLLQRLIRRMTLCRNSDGLVVATSDKPADDEIADACRSWGVQVFRGSEIDLASRMIVASALHNLDALVRVTGDNPLTSPAAVDDMIREYRAGCWDVVHYNHRGGYIYGTGGELFRIQALAICAAELCTVEREEIFATVRHDSRFKEKALFASAELCRPQYFLTVDYPEDKKLLDILYDHFGGRDDTPLTEIIALLDARPDLVAVNAGIHQQFPE